MAEQDKRKKPIAFSASFVKSDMYIYDAMVAYLEGTGQSTNSYIKELIHKDLDALDNVNPEG